ncbi:type VI secretion system tube protein Hcp [Yersinia enterocolitica]|uniref:type VI secretion system tube protein Hcp n=1 Tax=Yersinia enterocolitica TaxID=630 RepID=UPI001C6084D9|nr:type VI secretion system tube protein Hcp [Yersinia enterocolitica]MBW5823000.1 hypothetical protein [Yersinia enterocolitica]MBW5852872.1 hypothetical protein [Yersinia enterocolitica]MBW5870248.1 hypothetical protein [Yersinia enterocolitica]MBW5879042.1 hypothetical protein [Yersinia enterocolitica]MBX9477228.1 hypothetical protein [Yersinia enterocolitica]
MAKLPECQFIKITVDGKEIKGASEEEPYKGWMEGFAPTGLQAYSGVDGASFNPLTISLLMTKESSVLYETYLKRGHKTIDVTIVVRSSDKFGSQYESLKVEYKDCHFQYMVIETVDGRLFLNTSITVEGSVQVTMQVPNNTDSALDKIGPINYDIAAKALK